MKSYIHLFYSTLVLILLVSCEGKFEPITPNGPQTVELQFPNANEICLEGEFLASGELNVPFRWSSSDDANTYRLEVVNQTSSEKEVLEDIQGSSSEISVNLPLAPGTLYSWAVFAINDNVETKSEERSFYSRGAVFNTYAPFPATITVTDTSNGNITLDWQSTDIENDIVGYDVYLSTENPPALLLENTTTLSYEDTLTQGMTYYVEVVTKDTTGNRSIAKASFLVE